MTEHAPLYAPGEDYLSYGDPFQMQEDPGFIGRVGAEAYLGPSIQGIARGVEWMLPSEPGYKPMEDPRLKGNEQFAPWLADARSPTEFEGMLWRYKEAERARGISSQYGGLGSAIVGGLLQPENFVIPGISMGSGLLRGAARGAGYSAAVSVPLVAGARAVDPTAPTGLAAMAEELAYSAAFGGLLGGVLGAGTRVGEWAKDAHGATGRIARAQRELMAKLDADIDARALPEAAGGGSLGEGLAIPGTPATAATRQISGLGERGWEAAPTDPGRPTGISPVWGGLERLLGAGDEKNPIGTAWAWLVQSGHRGLQDLASMLGHDASLRLRENDLDHATAPGASMRAGLHIARVVDAVRELEAIYSRYLGKPNPVSVAGLNLSVTGARIGGAARKLMRRRRPDGRMEYNEFLDAVTRAVREDRIEPDLDTMTDTGEAAIGAVREGAARFQAYFESMAAEGKPSGFIPSPGSNARAMDRTFRIWEQNEARIGQLAGLTERSSNETWELSSRIARGERLKARMGEQGFANRDYARLRAEWTRRRGEGESARSPGMRELHARLRAYEADGVRLVRAPADGVRGVEIPPDTFAAEAPIAANDPGVQSSLDGGTAPPSNDPVRPQGSNANTREFTAQGVKPFVRLSAANAPRRTRGVPEDEQATFTVPDALKLSNEAIGELQDLVDEFYATPIEEAAGFPERFEALVRRLQEEGKFTFDVNKVEEVWRDLARITARDDETPEQAMVRKAFEELAEQGRWIEGRALKHELDPIRSAVEGAAKHVEGLSPGSQDLVPANDDLQPVETALTDPVRNSDPVIVVNGRTGTIRDGQIVFDEVQPTPVQPPADTPVGRVADAPDPNTPRAADGVPEGWVLKPANDDVDLHGPESDPNYFTRRWAYARIMADEGKGLRARFDQWHHDQGKAPLDDEQWQKILEAVTGGEGGSRMDANGVPVGGIFRMGRKLDIPNSYVMDYIETNAATLMREYAMRAGPGLEVHRAFGERDMEDAIFESIVQANRERTGTVAELATFAGEAQRRLHFLRDQVLGDLAVQDPLTLGKVTAESVKAYASVTMLGKTFFTQLVEVARPLMTHGFKQNFSFITDTMIGNLAGFQAASRDLRLYVGEALDVAMGITGQRLMELGDLNRPGSTLAHRTRAKLEPALSFAHGPWYILNLMGPSTDLMKNYQMVLSADLLISDMRRLANGTLGRKKTGELAALGVDRDLATQMLAQPIERSGRLNVANLSAWPDQELARRFAASIRMDVNRVISTASPTTKSSLSQGYLRYGEGRRQWAMMTLPFQFTAWSMSAASKITLSALQGRDANTFMGMATMIAAAYASNWMRTDQASWDRTALEERIFRAVDNSGILSIVGNLNQMLESATLGTVGARPALGMDPPFGNKDELDAAATALGPAGSKAVDAYRLLFDPELSTRQRVGIGRRMVPMSGLFYLDGLVKDATRGALDALDVPKR